MDQVENKIIEILEDPKWDWRTEEAILEGVEAVKNAPSLTEDAITKLLEDMEKRGIVVHAFSPKSSQRVYTTLRHYKEKRSFKDISVSSLSGSIQY